MRTYIKLVVTGVVAAATLAALVASASANRLFVNNRTIRVVWSSLETQGPVTVRCRVTLEGSFHENSLAKVERSLIGYVTQYTITHPCTGGSMWAYNGTERNEALSNTTFSSSFPWHFTYEGFDGALAPNPNDVRILLTLARTLMRATIGGIPVLCLYRTGGTNGNATGTAFLGAGGRVSSLMMSSRTRSESAFPCPETTLTSPTGDGIVTLLGTTNSISITLI